MSVYSAKTGIASILKSYSAVEREKAKNLAINKVRFQLPKDRGLIEAINAVINNENYSQYNEFMSFLIESEINEDDFQRIIAEAHKSIYLFKPQFSDLVETILSKKWLDYNNDTITAKYTEFIVDLLVAHNYYTKYFIRKLLEIWLPDENEPQNWLNGKPNDDIKKKLNITHKLLKHLLGLIPMSFEIIAEFVDNLFPYYTKPSHVLGGYIYNVLLLPKINSNFMVFVLELLFRKLVIIDVNAPRTEIEDFENMDDDDIADEAIFVMEQTENITNNGMKHKIANTLDLCIEQILEFLDQFNIKTNTDSETEDNTLKIKLNNVHNLLQQSFEKIILPSHNTNHIQFVVFYFCSFKPILAEKFLENLWNKIINPNISATIRQAAIYYIASFMARAKYLPLDTVKAYLLKMCTWSHQYIQRSDSVKTNITMKVHIVFFSICQSIFYLVAFRSRDLTSNNKNLQFLQSLQLSGIVTCNLNPLRVTLPVIATAFSGITRAYQLAYCHTILERNARRKLATVYANDQMRPEECLDTCFPFDPYLLKISNEKINPIYLQYHANEVEEACMENKSPNRRKRADSEMDCNDEADDFIMDKEDQFSYAQSPGFSYS